MKVLYTILASIAFSLTAIAQEHFFVISPKLVYEKPNSKSLEKGVLLRGAKVDVLNNHKDKWYEVTLDNGTKGFITKDYLGDALFGQDEYISSPAPIIDIDDYYGSPHLFITKSKVAVYKEPTKESTTIGKLFNGTPIALTYYPFEQNEWVNIGSFKDESHAFVEQYTLGKRPVFKDLVKKYNQSEFYEDKLKFSNEMLELSWQNNLEDQKTALEYAIKTAKIKKDINSEKYYSTLLKYVDGALNPVKVEDAESFFKVDQTGFVLNGVLEPIKGFTKSDIEITLGKRIKLLSFYNECTAEEGDIYRLYTLGTVGFNDSQRTTKIYELDITDKTGFRFNKYLFTSKTSMEGFVNVTKGFLSYYDFENNIFKVQTEMGGYDFYFTNNKLVKVVFYYYC